MVLKWKMSDMDLIMYRVMVVGIVPMTVLGVMFKGNE